MTLFLTSSPCVISAPRCILTPANGFIRRLKEHLPKYPRMLIVCADPEDHEMTVRFATDFFIAFREAPIPLGGFSVLDGTNADEAPFLVASSDLIVLMGGHVPTQNQFFRQIRLDSLLRDHPGVIMGISAGTMNAASIVYAQPELTGESLDPKYQRFIPGLGLTDVNILPHYQQVKDMILDGVRLYEDITIPDSLGRTFYALPDGSYLLREEDGTETFHGEIYRIKDGIMEWLSKDGENIAL